MVNSLMKIREDLGISKPFFNGKSGEIYIFGEIQGISLLNRENIGVFCIYLLVIFMIYLIQYR